MTSSRHLRALLVTALVCANLMVFVLSAYSLFRSYEHHEERAVTDTQNIASAVVQNLSGSIEKIDLALRAATDELERHLANGGIQESAMNEFLLRQAERLPEVVAFRVAGSDGHLVLGKDPNSRNPINWAGRDYFVYHRDHADTLLHVSKPFVGGVSKKYVIGFTRRFNRPDGSFGGVIIAPVMVDHFTSLLAQYDLGAKGSIVLRDTELALITRYPVIPDQPAGKIGNSAVSAEGRKLIASGIPFSTYHTKTSSDGLERILSFYRLDKAPFVVIAGKASQDYLANWWLEVYQTLAMAGSFLLLSLVLGGFLLRLLIQAARRERALHLSRERLKEAQHLAHLGSFEWIPGASEMTVSDEYFHLWGWEPGSVVPEYKRFLEGVHPEDVGALRASVQEALQGKGAYDFVHRVIWPDGSEHYIESQGRVTFDDAGQATRMIGTARDVTGKKQLEQEMARNEERMELALAGADLGLWDFDIPSGRFAHNPRFLDMIGYAAGEISPDTQTFLSLLHPDDAPGFYHHFYAHLKNETPRLEAEYRVRHKDEHWVWILCRGKVVERDENGRAVRITGTNLDISERKLSEASLKARQTRLATLISSMQDIVVVLDTGGTVVEYFQPPLSLRPTYLPAEQIVGRTYGETLPANVACLFDDALANIVIEGQPQRLEYVLSINGVEYLSQAIISPLLGELKYPTGFLVVIRDITAERAMQKALERVAHTNTLLLESVGEGIYGIDLNYRATFVNSMAQRMLGFSEAELREHEQHGLFHHHRQDGSDYPAAECPIRLTLEDGQIRHDENEWFWRKDGSGFPVALTVTPMMENGERVGVVVIFTDITERKANEERIRNLAFYDALTQLPNRRLLHDRLNLALPLSGRRDSHGAILFLDLDNFKTLNDTMGHDFGDLLLIEAARRLLGCVRVEDTVARLGGDEFVVMLGELSADLSEAQAQAMVIGEKIRDALGAPYILQGHQHHCTSSIGICAFKGLAMSVGEILKRADVAMYQAKSGGRNTIRMSAPDQT